LYISTELCEHGDLNDYIDYLNSQHTKKKVKSSTIFCTEGSSDDEAERNAMGQTRQTKLLPEKVVWDLLADMARAIKHVHDKGFVHLDIKPSNFFVTKEGQLKLGDFGIAINLSKVDSLVDSDQCGDSVYMAPELLKGHLSLKQRLTQKVDIFSLGASVLEIASSMNLP
jgi:mitosis inhibitor protein kinase SWE1